MSGAISESNLSKFIRSCPQEPVIGMTEPCSKKRSVGSDSESGTAPEDDANAPASATATDHLEGCGSFAVIDNPAEHSMQSVTDLADHFQQLQRTLNEHLDTHMTAFREEYTRSWQAFYAECIQPSVDFIGTEKKEMDAKYRAIHAQYMDATQKCADLERYNALLREKIETVENEMKTLTQVSMITKWENRLAKKTKECEQIQAKLEKEKRRAESYRAENTLLNTQLEKLSAASVGEDGSPPSEPTQNKADRGQVLCSSESETETGVVPNKGAQSAMCQNTCLEGKIDPKPATESGSVEERHQEGQRQPPTEQDETTITTTTTTTKTTATAMATVMPPDELVLKTVNTPVVQDEPDTTTTDTATDGTTMPLAPEADNATCSEGRDLHEEPQAPTSAEEAQENGVLDSGLVTLEDEQKEPKAPEVTYTIKPIRRYKGDANKTMFLLGSDAKLYECLDGNIPGAEIGVGVTRSDGRTSYKFHKAAVCTTTKPGK
jgi:hypothetical protein